MIRTNRAFTLVELLCVVTIVSFLASILFPVVARAKERAQRSVSANNLRQLAAGCLTYCTDYDDYLPFYRNDEVILLEQDPEVTTVNIPTDSRYPSLLVEALVPYDGNNRSIWFCPTDTYRLNGEPFGDLNHLYSSYLYGPVPNNFDLASTPWPWICSASDLAFSQGLFGEVEGHVGHQFRGYWTAPVGQYVCVDGHLEVIHWRD